MRIAIVHDWLVTYAGAERVLEQMLNIYPEADLFSIIDFLPVEKRAFIKHKKVNTSFIQNLPKARTNYRNYLPLMPLAIEQFDLSNYDLVISSSHAVAKGVLTGPDQIHICMCHTPIRYAWDLQFQYLKESNLDKGFMSFLVRLLLHKIRTWDVRSSNSVDHFIANSYFIKRRIEKLYRRDSVVIYPPVDIDSFTIYTNKDDFYLTTSRLVAYKKIPLIVEAFSLMPEKRLVVIGEGPDFDKCKALAGPNVSLLGWQPSNILIDFMKKAKAFVFAAEEDFGITPLEAQACGTPVIAFGKGGVLETINGLNSDKPTGVFFYEQTANSIQQAIELFEKRGGEITSNACRLNASRFSVERFRNELMSYIDQKCSKIQVR